MQGSSAWELETPQSPFLRALQRPCRRLQQAWPRLKATVGGQQHRMHALEGPPCRSLWTFGCHQSLLLHSETTFLNFSILQLMLPRSEAYLVDLCIALQLWRRAGEASTAGGLMQQILLPCGPEAR